MATISSYDNSDKPKIFWYISFIYLLIFVQYPVSAAISEQIFNNPLPTTLKNNVTASQLIFWGGIRLFIILPLILMLMTKLNDNKSKPELSKPNERLVSITFWFTLFFIILGIFTYPDFLSKSSLNFTNLLILLPYFSIYAISNAFVEEIFFRGVLLSYLKTRGSFFLANLLQAFLFASIHFTGASLTNKLGIFIFLTFLLGLAWGWVTSKTKSLLPAIILHIIADLFVAISLF